MGQVVVLALLGGLPYVVWGFVIRMLVTMHMTWFVNSAVHIWGRQTYDTNDSSRNNWCGRSGLSAFVVFVKTAARHCTGARLLRLAPRHTVWRVSVSRRTDCVKLSMCPMPFSGGWRCWCLATVKTSLSIPLSVCKPPDICKVSRQSVYYLRSSSSTDLT